MSKLRNVSLTVLLPSLVGGCIYPGCGNSGGLEERTEAYDVSEGELLAVLEADGTLSEDGCTALCEDKTSSAAIRSCVELEVEDSPAFAPATETGDTGMPAISVAARIECTWDEPDVCVGGRDHAAITSPSRGISEDPVLAWLQGTTHAETASVKAFVALARELEAFGAPDDLVRRCHAAARDEVAHARRVGELLAQRGGTRVPLRFQQPPRRTLAELAVENAVEGCVKEVWAAAVAQWQASHATDEGIRATMAPIARDEARHGDLARAIHCWAMSQLDGCERQRVLNARAEAVERLLADVDRDADPALVSDAGLPARAEARALAQQLAAHVWVADA